MREREREQGRMEETERELESVEIKDKQKDIKKQHVCQQQPTNSNQPTNVSYYMTKNLRWDCTT